LTAPPAIDVEELSWWAEQLVPKSAHFGFRLNAARKEVAYFLVDGEPAEIPLRSAGNDRLKIVDGAKLFTRHGRTIRLTNWRSAGAGEHTAHDGDILAPMPGKVIAVDVAAGETVTKGQRLLVLEAMKMEHALTAPFDGTVTELDVAEGQQVQVETLLAKVEKAES
jgi:3-methylcrotonyl-CoA carboxylase alpha subunit